MATASRIRFVVVGLAAGLGATLVPWATPHAGAAPTLSIRQVEGKVSVLNNRAERITEAYDGARTQLTTLQRQEQATQDTLDKDQQQLSSARNAVAASAVAAYRTGGLSPALSLVSTGSAETYIDRAGNLEALSQVQADQVALANAAQRQVAAVEAVRNAQLTQQRKTVAAIASTKGQVESLLGQEQALLGRLKAADRRRLEQEQAQQQQHETALRSSYHAPSYSGPASGRAAVAVRFAYAQLGKPYVYGGAGPNSYDCSGLTMRAWGAAGVGLPHNAAMQQSDMPEVSLSALEPGDLVFFGRPAYHVAIYIGGGKIIQAPHTGASVEITPLSYMTPTSAGRP